MEALTIKKQLNDYLQGAKDALNKIIDEAEKYAEYYTERGYIGDADDMRSIRDCASDVLNAFDMDFLKMLIGQIK